MHIHSVNDLRLMFLERIATEAPEATARLFELRDAGKWQAEYRVSADWLDAFLRLALEQEQEHMDSIASQVEARTALQTSIYWRNNPAGYATFGRVRVPIYIRRGRRFVQRVGYAELGGETDLLI